MTHRSRCSEVPAACWAVPVDSLKPTRSARGHNIIMGLLAGSLPVIALLLWDFWISRRRHRYISGCLIALGQDIDRLSAKLDSIEARIKKSG